MLNRAECESLLTRLVEHKRELDSQWDRLDKLIGAESETPFGTAVWRMMDVAIEFAGQLIGNEGHDWLLWFIWENDCGTKKLEASLPDGEMRKVCGVADMLDVLGKPKLGRKKQPSTTPESTEQ